MAEESLSPKKHIHTYVKATGAAARNNKYMKCDDPYCTHFALKEKIKGKVSLCAVCRINTLILDHEAMRRARPRCPSCSNTMEQFKRKNLIDDLERLGVK